MCEERKSGLLADFNVPIEVEKQQFCIVGQVLILQNIVFKVLAALEQHVYIGNMELFLCTFIPTLSLYFIERT